LKKSYAEPDEPKDYQPISNLTFITGLMPMLQSAYRRHHSSEMALVKVLSNALDAPDSGQVTPLVLLDLSTAFDIIDQDILIQRLRILLDFRGSALRWIESFLFG